ncbi:MAG: flippase-like domain-containing protein [Ignavibacteria bacterium]|nr:flippase-like domain-containing protein [Ignavibacteria bacterium]
MFSKYRRKILFSVVFGALVYLAISFYADFGKLIDAFSKFNWYWLPVILIFSFTNYIFRFIKWQYYLKELDIHLSTKRSFIIFLASFVMAVTPGKMGEVLKSYLLKDEIGIEISKSLPIVLAERITDFISMVLLAIVGAYVFNYGQEIIIIIGIIFIGIVVVLSFRDVSIKIINLISKIKFLKKYACNFLTAYESAYILIKFKPLIIATVISVFAWFCECIGFYIVLKGFVDTTTIDVNILVSTFVYAFSTLIGAIAMMPGGLGATEASLTGLLVLLNIPKDISAASTIIIRVATLWFAVIIGIIFLLIYEHTNSSIDLKDL